MNDITRESITLAVMEGLEKYDNRRKEEIEKMCEKNVKIALSGHRDTCPGSSRGNLTGVSSLGIGISLVVERMISYFHKGS